MFGLDLYYEADFGFAFNLSTESDFKYYSEEWALRNGIIFENTLRGVNASCYGETATFQEPPDIF